MLNVPPSQYSQIEQRMQLMHGLATQAASNLTAFYLLLPQEEQELKQIIFIVSSSSLNLLIASVFINASDNLQLHRLIHQRNLLLQHPEIKRFIFCLEHLTAWQDHLTKFLLRIKALMSRGDSPGPNPGRMPPMKQQSQTSIQQLQLLQNQQPQFLAQQQQNGPQIAYAD